MAPLSLYCLYADFGLQVVLLDVLEVVYSAYLELYGSCIVAYDDAMWVELKYADGSHLSNGTLYGMVQSLSLVVAIGKNEHLLGIHDSAYTYGYGSLGHLVHVVVEET